MDKKKVEKLFQEDQEDEMVRLSAYVPASIKADLEKAAEITGKSVNQVLTKILIQFFREK